MSTSGEQVYEDQWGAILDRPGYIEIRWYDTTRGMTWEDFQKFLTTFVEAAERHRRSGALVGVLGAEPRQLAPRRRAAGASDPAGQPQQPHRVVRASG